MRKLNPILFAGSLLLALVTGCQAIVPTAQILSQGQPFNLSAAPAVTSTETLTSTSPVTTTAMVEVEDAAITETETIEVSKDLTDSAAMTDTTAITDSGAMTETPAVTDTTAVTETPVLTDSAVVTEGAPVTATAEVTATTEVTATAPVTDTTATTTTTTTTETTTAGTATATATIAVASLRIRTGPSTDAEVVGGAVQGENYPITGQALDCQWYQITHPVLGTVWIAGGEFTTADSDCAQIPATAATDATALPAAPAEPAAPADPAATPVPAEETSTTPTIQPTPTPAEPAAAADPFPADQGCLLLQNQLGPELTFTFTKDDGSYNDTVQVTADNDVSYCVAPGRYRVTVDAPPPWADLNEEFTLNAGDRFFFPIRPR